jgi:hypothetical protein
MVPVREIPGITPTRKNFLETFSPIRKLPALRMTQTVSHSSWSMRRNKFKIGDNSLQFIEHIPEQGECVSFEHVPLYRRYSLLEVVS